MGLTDPIDEMTGHRPPSDELTETQERIYDVALDEPEISDTALADRADCEVADVIQTFEEHGDPREGKVHEGAIGREEMLVLGGLLLLVILLSLVQSVL